MTAEQIITLYKVSDIDHGDIARLSPAEYLTVVDAIIDRTFEDDTRRENLQRLLESQVEQRYYERQVASAAILPPLLPWFVRSK